MSTQDGTLNELWRRRPRSRLLRASLWLLGGATVCAWAFGGILPFALLTERRLANLQRFLSSDVVPHPLREAGFSFDGFLSWAGALFADKGGEAALATLAIAVLANGLAGVLSFLFAPLAASNLATARPFDGSASESTGERGWRALRIATRLVLILLRAVPEYLLAFLLLSVLGPGTAWAAILALAFHNGGILGRLGAETIENLEPAALRTLRELGAPRRTILFAGVLPQALGRYLLYFFYRFETCVREASILGMLGIVSLGYWIEDTRTKHYYDEMLFFVALGAVLVLAADLASSAARRYARRA